MQQYKTFEELERIAYMKNLPKIANLYAQLDDNEKAENEIERLCDKIYDLEYDVDFLTIKRNENEAEIEELKKKLEKIADIVNE